MVSEGSEGWQKRRLEWPGPPRLLTDWEIAEACRTHRLVTVDGEGAHSELSTRVRHCSYELTVSNRVQILVDNRDRTMHQDHDVETDGFWVPAGATVRVFSREVLELPKCVFAQCVGLGQLFSAGVIVGSTYVDPGSKGAIYLSMTNVGHRAVRIREGQPLARGFFHVLGADVEKPHPGAGGRRKIVYELGQTPSRTSGADGGELRERLKSLELQLEQLGNSRGLPPGNAVAVVAATAGVAFAILGASLALAIALLLAAAGSGWPLWLLLPAAGVLSGVEAATFASELMTLAPPPRWLHVVRATLRSLVFVLLAGIIVNLLYDELR